MNNKKFWVTLSLGNLCIVAFLGFILRSKILFPLQSVNYKNFINAHSHFAFGGWVTLSLLTLFTYALPEACQRRKVYQWMFWGFEITSMGMLFSFPFEGYGVTAIVFSTLFIFFTYGYSFFFIRDLLNTGFPQPVKVLSIFALVSLILSSAGPFTLAWLLGSGSGDAILYKDCVYFYLHFQYNGFFIPAVFALLFNAAFKVNDLSPVPASSKWFAWILCLSAIPSYFLTLLWHSQNLFFKLLATAGVIAILVYLVLFFSMATTFRLSRIYRSGLARSLVLLVLVSFVIKSLLQIGTLFPGLGNAVFGLRPIIIGFLHLVFLGIITFYIFSNYIEAEAFNIRSQFTRIAFLTFITAVIVQETILLVQGIGLLLGQAYPVYTWLLWYISIFLFLGAMLIFLARLKCRTPLLF